MNRQATAALTLAALLSPVAAAQMETDVPVVNDTDEPEEAVAVGLSTTVVIILIVLAVLVVALIVAMATRGP